MKKTLLLLTAAVGLFAASCQNATNTSTSTAATTIIGKWRNTYYKTFNIFNGVVQPPIDVLAVMAALDSCVVDDLTEFRAGGGYYYDQGTTPCVPNSPQELRGGTWQLANNDQDLIFKNDSGAVISKWRVLSLTSSRLELYADSTILDANGQIGASMKLLSIYEK